MDKTGSKCLFEFDKSFKKLIIGTDEAGRGPAAGGVFASAVYFPEVNKKITEELSILNDSKQLSAKKREYLYDIILNETINETVCVEVDDIEKYNILASSLRAMKLACEGVIARIKNKDILVLVDGNKLIREFAYPQQYLIKGDGKSASIAAASILAKVTRDRLMVEYEKVFPGYDFASNKGYGTKAHIEGLKKFGPTPIHRMSFIHKYI